MLASSRDALALWRFALGRHGPLDHDERMSTSSRCSSASVSSIEDIARMNAGITTPLISCCKSIGSPESANRSHLAGRLATRRRQWQRSLLAAHDPSSVSAASAAAVDKVFRRGSAAAGNALPPALTMVDDTVGGYRTRRGTLIGISIYTMQRDPRWRGPDADSCEPMRFYDMDIVGGTAEPGLHAIRRRTTPLFRCGDGLSAGAIPARPDR